MQCADLQFIPEPRRCHDSAACAMPACPPALLVCRAMLTAPGCNHVALLFAVYGRMRPMVSEQDLLRQGKEVPGGRGLQVAGALNRWVLTKQPIWGACTFMLAYRCFAALHKSSSSCSSKSSNPHSAQCDM